MIKKPAPGRPGSVPALDPTLIARSERDTRALARRIHASFYLLRIIYFLRRSLVKQKLGTEYAQGASRFRSQENLRSPAVWRWCEKRWKFGVRRL